MRNTIKNKWLLKKTQEVAIEVFREISSGEVESTEVPSFEYKGFNITTPIFDETLRDDVNPIDYYGEENIVKYLSDAKDKGYLETKKENK